MSRPVIILGAGGHARVVASTLLAAGRSVVAVAAPDGADDLAMRLGAVALTSDDAVLTFAPNTVELILGVGMVGPSPLRRRIMEKFRTAGFRFATLVHPAAFVDPTATLEQGAVVMAGAVVQTGCRIGDNVIVNSRAVVDHDCTIAAHVHLATGCILCGDVKVGEASHVGAGATIIQGLHIGAGALIAAGATVVRPVADATRVAGTPARPF